LGRLFYPTKQEAPSRKLSRIRLYSTNSPVNRSLLSTIKDHTDPNLVILQLPGKQLVLSRNFLEWLRGFTDAEGSFMITKITNSISFQFKYQIALHVDDIKVLELIQSTLNIGNIKMDSKNSAAVFYVTAKEEIEVIIGIFANFNLNTTKYLNFLSFAEAFTLYIKDKSRKAREEAKPLILEIIGGMNKNRSNFNMNIHNHQIKVTSYWLLGFVEGDGSFYLHSSSNNLYFSIRQKGNLPLMEAIKHYLLSMYDISGLHHKNPQIPNLSTGEFIKIDLDGLGVSGLRISDNYFFEDVLIPFFDHLTWQTKKYLDYCDWKALCEIIKLGHHYTPEGLALIKRITSQTNNDRLSTSKTPKAETMKLLEDIKEFLKNNPSNYEIRDGRIFIKSSSTFLKNTRPVSVCIKDVSTGEIIHSFKSFSSCGKFLGIHNSIVSSREQKKTEFTFNGKLITIHKIEKKS
jgi:hypothetical protein